MTHPLLICGHQLAHESGTSTCPVALQPRLLRLTRSSFTTDQAYVAEGLRESLRSHLVLVHDWTAAEASTATTDAERRVQLTARQLVESVA